ncbi:MAG: SDR family oxidoreductase [Clostridia bacterium]|nr:SDR family oxidoreductase [Clostridia bacterium]
MKALFIGGTGTISTEISKLCVQKGWDLTLLNRGNASSRVPEGARVLCADIHDEQAVASVLGDETFDVVADFIAFTPEHVERDIRLFTGKTQQYLFISSASAYQKPLSSPWITEGTPLHNPYWEYSRNKIACEDVLMKAYHDHLFPVTIVRPSHTYCERSVPVALHGTYGSYQVLERIRQGKKIIVPGDGATLWTVTHSRDFAVAFEGLMGNAHAMGEIFHITSDESLTWNQIYETIGRVLGKEVKMVHIASETLGMLSPEWVGALTGDKSNTVLFDNTKIKRAVPQFNASIRFDQGVREALDYIYSHEECQTPDPRFDAWCDEVIEKYESMIAGMPIYMG